MAHLTDLSFAPKCTYRLRQTLIIVVVNAPCLGRTLESLVALKSVAPLRQFVLLDWRLIDRVVTWV